MRIDKDGWLSFPHIDDCIVDNVLKFMYTFDYDNSEPDRYDGTAMEFHVDAYTAAHRLDMPALKRLASSRVCAAADEFADIDDFISGVRKIYKDAPSSAKDLRNNVVAVAVAHADQLLMYSNSTGKFPYRDLVDELKRFGTDFQLALVELRGNVQQRHCSICDRNFTTDRRKGSRVHCPYCKRLGGLAP